MRGCESVVSGPLPVAGTKADLSSLVSKPGGSQDLLLRLVPIESAEHLELFRIASAWDGHANMLAPTHMLVRPDGDIVGGTSLGKVALANTWLHTEKLRPLETVRAANLIENVHRALRYRYLCVPAPESSPMFKAMTERFGYRNLGVMGIFVKEL